MEAASVTAFEINRWRSSAAGYQVRIDIAHLLVCETISSVTRICGHRPDFNSATDRVRISPHTRRDRPYLDLIEDPS